MIKCKNCNTEITDNYCSNCGQAANLKRIDGHYVLHEIRHILHFEKGFLYTLKSLVTNPGENIRHFFTESRARLVKPIIFIIVCSLIYTIIMGLFHFDLTVGKVTIISISGTLPGTPGKLLNWIQNHLGYANIYFGIFIAFWLRLLFRKHEYNVFEILILMCYILGISMLIHSITTLILGITNIDLLKLGGTISIVYTTWALGHFFDKSKASSYVKSLLAFFLGMATSFLFLALLGTSIDFLKKLYIN